MKKAMMFACVLGFGIFIGSCKGNFGDLFGTSDNDGSDSTGCHHHHGGNDHDADDTVIVKDTATSNYLIQHSN